MAHRRARFFRVPQIALEIEKRGRCYLVAVERRCRQELRRAQKGVHRALRIGGDEDQAAGSRHLAVALRGCEFDAERADVVREHLAELVTRHLADETGAKPERGEASHGVGRRPAADLSTGRHVAVQTFGFLGIDQPHRAFHKLLGHEEILLDGDQHVDNRIADRKNVEA
jgi:hypothetical protein